MNNVASTGTFICPSELDVDNIERNANTIPEGWNIIRRNQPLTVTLI